MLARNFVGCLVRRCHPLLKHELRASKHMIWPEPVTLPTITEFLDEINYYEEPRKFIDIGAKVSTSNRQNKAQQTGASDNASKNESVAETDLDTVMQLLDKEFKTEALDFDNLNSEWVCSPKGIDQLARLATHFGIYRDLFSQYEGPKKGPITFTRNLAERLNKFIPHYWITDLPFSKVPLEQPEDPSMLYFIPIVPLVAKFIPGKDSNLEDEEISSQVVYHGNYISACDAHCKPSIALDGRVLTDETDTINCFQSSWTSGEVQLNNFSSSYNNYLSLVLLNLDTIYGNDSMLHWMITNLRPGKSGSASYNEVCEFLPVYGINGFGHSRYVFVLFEHCEKLELDKAKINEFSAQARRFNTMKFMEQNKSINLRPVGLSWFQTKWDLSSNSVFQDYLKMRVPQYEHVITKKDVSPNKAYPGRVPFNIYLDYHRDKKDINKQVLLERLKNIDPFNYRDQYIAPKVPADIHKENVPDWMKMTVWKKNNKLGYWRGLRPASALLPLNNNADLDQPCRPLPSSNKAPFLRPNPYPGGPKIKAVKDLPYSKTNANEQPSVFIMPDHEIHLSETERKELD